MTERQYIDKYGFSLDDLEVACIDDLMRKSYMCYSVKELAYKIASDVYEELKVDVDYYIMYKLTKWQNNYIHKIAFYLEDLVFIFDICWRGSALSVEDWCVVSEKEFETYKGYEDIECVLEDEDEEE